MAVLEFDYVIIGAGTAGLTAAARLTEDPSISVVVLEAGQHNLDDPKITVPGQFTQTFTNPQYDWAFPTIPQKHSNGKVSLWHRGKGIGGTSGMNFYCWIKPPAEDVDAIERLGNPGWNWNNFMKYSQLTEKFHVASKEHSAVYPHTHNPEYRGTSGPIDISTPHHVHTIDLLFQQSFVNKGLNAVIDPYGGDITGTWMASATMHPKSWTRSYATTAYYVPNKDRSNLTVLTEAFVSRVLLSNIQGGDDLTATGVEFTHGGKGYTVKAKNEVILSAGTIKSPHILELSGIGRKDMLSKIGVGVKIELPGVGENVQDHIMGGVTWELNPDAEHETLDLLRDSDYAANAMKLHTEGKGLYRVGITSFAFFPLSAANSTQAPSIIESVAKQIAELKTEGKLPPGLAEQYDIQLETLRSDTLPDLEVVAIPGHMSPAVPPESGKKYVTVLFMLQHPFSRGHIHATSKDPVSHPEIDPNYFAWDIDLELMVQNFKYVRSLCDVEPWKSGVHREIDPGPECQTDDQIRDWIKNWLSSTWHTIGSCSMLPRDKRGVVDPNLKVYGTTNLRIADLSIYPLHLASHTQTLAYAVGEKVADIITGRSRI